MLQLLNRQWQTLDLVSREIKVSKTFLLDPILSDDPCSHLLHLRNIVYAKGAMDEANPLRAVVDPLPELF